MILSWRNTLYVISLITLPLSGKCGDDGVYGSGYFKEPSSRHNNADHYLDQNGNEFAIINSRATFYEAGLLCKNRNGELVTLNRVEDGFFLSEVLAESDQARESFWIGGQFKGGKWIWEGTNIAIRKPRSSKGPFPMRTDPFWSESPNPHKSANQSCLGYNRMNHKDYVIAPLPCGIPRPFICRISSNMENVTDGAILQIPVIKGEHFDYYLYYAAFTWVQAASFCLEKDLKLTTLDFPGGPDSEMYTLAQRMLRSRPVMENAWINGKYDKERKMWMWVSDNNPIKLVANGKGAANPEENDPPWFRGADLFEDGCLLLDRHLCEGPVFVESNCDKKRSFICQGPSDGGSGGHLEFRHVDGTNLWLSFIPKNWMRASQRCVECFENDGTLLSLENKVGNDKTMKAITDAMAHWNEEVNHIWLSGHLNSGGNTWNWYDSKDTQRQKPLSIINEKLFDKMKGETSNVKVSADCLTKKVMNLQLNMFQCLNLDRENQRHVFIYGLNCEFAQSYFCESTAKSSSCGGTITDTAITDNKHTTKPIHKAATKPTTKATTELVSKAKRTTTTTTTTEPSYDTNLVDGINAVKIEESEMFITEEEDVTTETLEDEDSEENLENDAEERDASNTDEKEDEQYENEENSGAKTDDNVEVTESDTESEVTDGSEDEEESESVSESGDEDSKVEEMEEYTESEVTEYSDEGGKSESVTELAYEDSNVEELEEDDDTGSAEEPETVTDKNGEENE